MGEKDKITLGIVGVLSNPAKKETSHNGGWTYVLKSICETQLGRTVSILTEKDDWSAFNELLLNEGVNYKEGIYNLFGGVNDKLKKRLSMLNDFKGRIYCFGDHIDYNDLCKKRNIDFSFSNEITYLNPKNMGRSLVFGDSHSISVYKEGFAINRNDGATLHGMLKKRLSTLIDTPGMEKLIFYAGNIDLRHHWCRHIGESTPKEFIRPIIKELEIQIKELNFDEINLVELLPIEDESRKIPGTGMYKKEPFYGSWKQRNDLRKEFNKELKLICEKNNWELLVWPTTICDELGKLKFEAMESKSSVHLAPKSYMYAEGLIYRKQLSIFDQ